jgi:hypothetical protein
MDCMGREDVDDDINSVDPHNHSAKHHEESMPCQSEFPTLGPLFHHLKDHKHPSSRGHELISSKSDDSDARESSPADDSCAPQPEQHEDNKTSIEDLRLDRTKPVPMQEAHSDGLPSKLLHHDVELVAVQAMADMKMSAVDHISKDDVLVREATMGAKHEGTTHTCMYAYFLSGLSCLSHFMGLYLFIILAARKWFTKPCKICMAHMHDRRRRRRPLQDCNSKAECDARRSD